MTQLVFWGCVETLFYLYVGFPLLLLARARLRPHPYRTAGVTPSVSVVIAARNEADVIGKRIENLIALDYPDTQLEVVLASDGSGDATNEIVRPYVSDRVRLLELGRVGKAEALNAAVGSARGEILVFSDANSMFRPDAVRQLVRPFADERVGGVAGNQVYLPTVAGDASAVGEQQYWSLDRLLKRAQSASGSVTGATGAIYAIRRSLFEPIRGDVNDDLLTSLRVIAQGYRLVFAPEAIAYEQMSETVATTFSRRVRVMVRGLRCVVVMKGLLDPRRYGFFAVQLLTHKLLLRTAVIPLALLAAATGLSWNAGFVYRAAAVLQGLFYLLGIAGIALAGHRVAKLKPFALPAYFCLVNAASAKAMWTLIRGRTLERWEPTRPMSGSHAA